jgi:hypothetical protein
MKGFNPYLNFDGTVIHATLPLPDGNFESAPIAREGKRRQHSHAEQRR